MCAKAICRAFAALVLFVACSNQPQSTETKPSNAVVEPKRTGPQGPPLGVNNHPINTQEPRLVSDCVSYMSMPNIYGYCLVQVAGRGQGMETATDVCGDAGDWETECRMAWVASRSEPHTRWSMEDLLASCPQHVGDCHFEVIDTRWNKDVFVQMDLCFKHARSFTGDCIAHALDRWIREKPSRDEVVRVANTNIAPDRIGHYIAAAYVCHGTIDGCLGGPLVMDSCEFSLKDFKLDSGICKRLSQSIGDSQVPMGP